jgi:hypothetical protein
MDVTNNTMSFITSEYLKSAYVLSAERAFRPTFAYRSTCQCETGKGKSEKESIEKESCRSPEGFCELAAGYHLRGALLKTRDIETKPYCF